MKKLSLFIPSVLVLALSAAVIVLREGFALLPLLYIAFLIVPALHFILVNLALDRKESTAITIIATSLLFASEFIAFALFGNGVPSQNNPMLLLSLVWAALCGVLITGNHVLTKRGGLSAKAAVAAEAAAFLTLNATFPLFSVRLSTALHIEYSEIMLLAAVPLCIAFVSFFVGKLFAARKPVLPLAVWLALVCASEIVCVTQFAGPGENLFRPAVVSLTLTLAAVAFAPSLFCAFRRKT
ncbi:MAG: hypothetical protein II739_03270 [Clostridia bacterium]|nr:hypothetical protein [Clostridia bacterium]